MLRLQRATRMLGIVFEMARAERDCLAIKRRARGEAARCSLDQRMPKHGVKIRLIRLACEIVREEVSEVLKFLQRNNVSCADLPCTSEAT